MATTQYSYSEKYFAEGMSGWHALSYESISRTFHDFVATSPIRRLLDFGCGDGFYGRLLSQHCEQLDGVDLSAASMILRNRTYYKNIFETDLGKVWEPPGESYDILFSSEVIEHVEDYQQFLGNAFRATNPGGKLFLTTTTYSCSLFIFLISYTHEVTFTALVEFFRGWFGDLECRSKFVQRLWAWTKGHHHGFSKRQLKKALLKSGFCLERVEYLHVQPVIYPEFFSNPFTSVVRYRPLLLVALSFLRLGIKIINSICRRLDLYAPNVLLTAYRPLT